MGKAPPGMETGRVPQCYANHMATARVPRLSVTQLETGKVPRFKLRPKLTDVETRTCSGLDGLSRSARRKKGGASTSKVGKAPPLCDQHLPATYG